MSTNYTRGGVAQYRGWLWLGLALLPEILGQSTRLTKISYLRTSINFLPSFCISTASLYMSLRGMICLFTASQDCLDGRMRIVRQYTGLGGPSRPLTKAALSISWSRLALLSRSAGLALIWAAPSPLAYVLAETSIGTENKSLSPPGWIRQALALLALLD
ncbi:hypothetical protein GGR56DRAFT_459992 [Xylariaceae sp. FL0804]|nr:hypothetical protein GGR56DRAFT_459992 [Xylariaceae sp. FL0804]